MITDAYIKLMAAGRAEVEKQEAATHAWTWEGTPVMPADALPNQTEGDDTMQMESRGHDERVRAAVEQMAQRIKDAERINAAEEQSMYLDTPEERYRSGPIEGRKEKDAQDHRKASVWVANIDNGDTVVHIDEGAYRHSIVVLDASGREALMDALSEADDDATGDDHNGTMVSNHSWTYDLLGEQVMVHTTVVRYPLDKDNATG